MGWPYECMCICGSLSAGIKLQIVCVIVHQHIAMIGQCVIFIIHAIIRFIGYTIMNSECSQFMILYSLSAII